MIALLVVTLITVELDVLGCHALLLDDSNGRFRSSLNDLLTFVFQTGGILGSSDIVPKALSGVVPFGF